MSEPIECPKSHQYLTDFLYIMEHVEKKVCPICKLKVPKGHALCPNCGFNPPIAGGFCDEEDFKEMLKSIWKWWSEEV